MARGCKPVSLIGSVFLRRFPKLLERQLAQVWGAIHQSTKSPTLIPAAQPSVFTQAGGTQEFSLPFHLGLEFTLLLKSSLIIPYIIFLSSTHHHLTYAFSAYWFNTTLSHKNLSSMDSCLFCSFQWALNEYFFNAWSSLAIIFHFDYLFLLARLWPQEWNQPGIEHLSVFALWIEVMLME